MIEFLEELAAIITKKKLKCKNCGYVLDRLETREIEDTDRCPKCGEKDWKETCLTREEMT